MGWHAFQQVPGRIISKKWLFVYIVLQNSGYSDDRVLFCSNLGHNKGAVVECWCA